MEDILATLMETLNSKEGQESLRGLMSLLPSESEKAPQNDELGIDLSAVMALKNAATTCDDDSVRLMQALKPMLSPHRQERVDRAVRLMKIYSLMPMLRESGLLNDLF